VPTSLTSRVQSGVIWNAFSVASTYLLGLVRSVIMARLLLAEDFGLFGMALTVVTGLSALTNIGLDISVINTKFKDDAELSKHLDTLWTIDLVRRLLLALLMLALARPAAKFYGEARVSELLLVLSVLPLLQGFQNIGLMIHRKGVNFKKIVWLELITNLLTAVATIALVLWTRNVWALVLSQLVAALIGVALSYAFHPYRPRLRLEGVALKLALGFGKYAFLIGVLNYVMTMADNVLLGRLYSAAILGTYVIAYNLAVLPLHGVANAIVNVTFPAYAEIAGGGPALAENSDRGDKARLERAFGRVFAASSTLLTFTTALLLLLGDEIVVFLYGSKWRAAGTILRILALLVFCKGHGILVSPLIVSMRGIAPDAKIKMLEAAIFLALLYPLTSRYGAVGAAWAGAIAFFVMMINRLRVAASLLPNVAGVLLRTVLSATAACALGVGLGAFVIGAVGSVLARLLLGGSVVTVVVAGVMLILTPSLRTELLRFIAGNSRRVAPP
jgi:PST family polysaccharide transporter